MDLKMLVVLLMVFVSTYAEPMRDSPDDRPKYINRPSFPRPPSDPFPRRDVTNDWSNRRLAREIDDSMHQRSRRSPEDGKKGSVVLSGSHTKGQFGGPSQNSARVDYNHNLWRGKNGASIDANTYYQRNWGGGPRRDYGGGIRGSIPFGRR